MFTVTAEQSAGAACGCCRGGYWTVVEALIPTGSIAAVHTCSGLTPAPSSTTSELPRQYNLIRVVTLHAAVMASGFLTYLIVCGASTSTAIRFATSSIVWFLQKPQVMLLWCCGMVESLVSHASSQG